MRRLLPFARAPAWANFLRTQATSMNQRIGVALLFGGLSLVAAVGCEKSERIERYTVAKPPPIEPLASKNPHGANPHQFGAALSGPEEPTEPPKEPTDRTLGAIVPQGDKGWFFKLTGPKDAVAAKADDFTALVKSVHFSAAGKPQWTLPAGWQEQPGGDIRYATLSMPGEGKLEVSVTVLPKSLADEEYVLVNVNRWRGQLKLPPTTAEALAGESTPIKLAGATATVVNLLGVATGGGMRRPPFVPGARDGN